MGTFLLQLLLDRQDSRMLAPTAPMEEEEGASLTTRTTAWKLGTFTKGLTETAGRMTRLAFRCVRTVLVMSHSAGELHGGLARKVVFLDQKNPGHQN